MWLISAYSVIVIRQGVQVVDDWLGLAQLTVQQHLSYLIAMGMVLSKAPITGALPCRNKIRYICLVTSLQIRLLNKERTMKEIEQV